MDWVLDPSLALAWGLPDEGSKPAERFLGRLEPEAALWVPPLWWYEVANALSTARRRNRLKAADVIRLMELYASLPVLTDTLLGREAMYRFHTLAHQLGLSVYAAAYLELAQRRGIGLATLDARLAAAAKSLGVRTLSSTR